MRYLSLFFHKIRLHIRTNPLLLTVFCLGGFVCTLSVIIMYGNVMPHITRETPEKYYRSFDVFLNQPVSVQSLDVANTVYLPYGGYGIEDIIVNTSLESGKTDVKASLKNRIFEDFSSDAAFSFDLPNLQNQMILSKITASHKQTDTFELFGNTYSVVGVASDNYITYSEFWTLDLAVNKFRVILETKPTSALREEFTQLLYSKFPGCRVRNADYYIKQDRELTVSAIGVMVVLYLLLFLSLAFILYDILRSELYVHLVFRLHGATSRKLLCLIATEQLFMLTLSGGLACLTHHIFYGMWFESFNLYANLSYGWMDYAVIVLATDVIALCCMLPFLRKIMSKYSYQMKKEATVF